MQAKVTLGRLQRCRAPTPGPSPATTISPTAEPPIASGADRSRSQSAAHLPRPARTLRRHPGHGRRRERGGPACGGGPPLRDPPADEARRRPQPLGGPRRRSTASPSRLLCSLPHAALVVVRSSSLAIRRASWPEQRPRRQPRLSGRLAAGADAAPSRTRLRSSLGRPRDDPRHPRAACRRAVGGWRGANWPAAGSPGWSNTGGSWSRSGRRSQACAPTCPAPAPAPARPGSARRSTPAHRSSR